MQLFSGCLKVLSSSLVFKSLIMMYLAMLFIHISSLCDFFFELLKCENLYLTPNLGSFWPLFFQIFFCPFCLVSLSGTGATITHRLSFLILYYRFLRLSLPSSLPSFLPSFLPPSLSPSLPSLLPSLHLSLPVFILFIKLDNSYWSIFKFISHLLWSQVTILLNLCIFEF